MDNTQPTLRMTSIMEEVERYDVSSSPEQTKPSTLEATYLNVETILSSETQTAPQIQVARTQLQPLTRGQKIVQGPYLVTVSDKMVQRREKEIAGTAKWGRGVKESRKQLNGDTNFSELSDPAVRKRFAKRSYLLFATLITTIYVIITFCMAHEPSKDFIFSTAETQIQVLRFDVATLFFTFIIIGAFEWPRHTPAKYLCLILITVSLGHSTLMINIVHPLVHFLIGATTTALAFTWIICSKTKPSKFYRKIHDFTRRHSYLYGIISNILLLIYFTISFISNDLYPGIFQTILMISYITFGILFVFILFPILVEDLAGTEERVIVPGEYVFTVSALLLYFIVCHMILTHVFLLIRSTGDSEIPSSYCSMRCDNYYDRHTLCRFKSPELQVENPSCFSTKGNSTIIKSRLTGEDISLIIYMHNVLRARVRGGFENRGNSGPQPAARDLDDIPLLEWDRELQRIAQTWANQCQYRGNYRYNSGPAVNDECRDTLKYKVGQNTFWKATRDDNSYNVERQYANVSMIVNLWSNEVNHFNCCHIEKFRSNPQTDHYTQMVWGSTTHLGCGVVIAKDENKNDENPSYIQHLVCNYGPRGNVKGYDVYKAKNSCECSNF